MHPRNRFKDNKPDFGAYAMTRPGLKPHLIQRKHTSAKGFQYTLNFSSSEALRELTCACLDHEFGLKIEIPDDHMVPAVPQRLNYIHWLEDLLSDEKGVYPRGNKIVGIDIGTGSSCIYPLLGAKLNEWKFLATEIQPVSLKYAQKNVTRNNFDANISVLQVAPDVILAGIVDHCTQYSFCMCNPPFYHDKDDQLGGASRSGHRPIPRTQNTGNEAETITKGGEVEFVRRIIMDSLTLGTTIRWYTTMLGKKASLKSIKSILHENNVPVVVNTEFVQGKTHRWAIGWSFDTSLKHKMFQGATSSPNKRIRPYIISLTGFSSDSEGLSRARDWLSQTLKSLQVLCDKIEKEDEHRHVWHCKTQYNTWSHQRKRRRLMEKIKQIQTKTNEEDTASSQIKEKPDCSVQTEDQEAVNPQALEEEHNILSAADLLTQLESFNIPCVMEFTCSLELLDEQGEESKVTKVRKSQEKSSDPQRILVCTFEWINGGSKDELHQIVQLLQNWAP